MDTSAINATPQHVSPLQRTAPTDPAQRASANSSQTAPSATADPIGAAATPDAVAEAGKAAESTTDVPQEDLWKALQEVRDAISPVARDLQFSIEEDTGQTVVKIVDSKTDEVIRQIPSEELVAISKALDRLQGLLIKQTA